MFNFLGVSQNLSVLAGDEWCSTFRFLDAAEGEAVVLDGVTLNGAVHCAAGDVVIGFDHREEPGVVDVSFPPLPEGRWPYDVWVTSENGGRVRLLEGRVAALGKAWLPRAVEMVESPGAAMVTGKTMNVLLPGGVGELVRLEWAGSNVAVRAAREALESKKGAENAKADAESTLGEVRAVQEDIGQSVQFVAGLTNDAEAAKRQAESAAESARGYSTSADSSLQGARDAKSRCEAALTEVNDAVQSFAGVVAAEKAASIAAIEEAGAAAKAEVSEISAGVQGAVSDANASADAAEAAQNKAQEIADGVNAILEEAAQEAAQKEVADIHEQLVGLVSQAHTYELQAAGHASFADSYARAALGFRDFAEEYQVETKGYRDEVKGYVDNVTTMQGEVTTMHGEVTTMQGEVTTMQGEVTTMHGEVTAADARVAEAVSSIDAKVTAASESIDAKVTAASESIDAKVTAASESIDAKVAASLAERVNSSGFYRMTQAEYDALATRPVDAVYFIGSFS